MRELLVCLDDEVRLRSLPRCRHPCLQRLRGGVREGLGFILQNAPHAVIERVEGEPDCGGFLALSDTSALARSAFCQLGWLRDGVVGVCSVLLEHEVALRLGRFETRRSDC